MRHPYAELVDAPGAAALVADPAVVVVDARYWLGQEGRGRAAHEAGHLPGARFVDVDAELAGHPVDDPSARPGTHPGGRHPRPGAERLTAAARRLGIDDDTTVLVHDQRTNLSSAWLVWLLRDAGFTGRLVVLDGGFAAWEQAGGIVDTTAVPDGNGTFVARPGHLPALLAADVPAHLGAGHRLVDVRARERFEGATEPVDPVAGHVPGAVNLPVTALQRDDGRLLGPDGLRERLAGLRPGDAFSCGSGLTASQALLAAELAGIDGLAIHPGSWSDWISDPARPVAVGAADFHG